jgi:hypothetical protein
VYSKTLRDGKLATGWLGKSAQYSCQIRGIQNEGFTKEWGVARFSFRINQHGTDFKNYFDHLRSQLGVLPAQYVEPLPQYVDPVAEPSTMNGNEYPPPVGQGYSQQPDAPPAYQ